MHGLINLRGQIVTAVDLREVSRQAAACALALFPTAVMEGTRQAVRSRGSEIGADRISLALDPTTVTVTSAGPAMHLFAGGQVHAMARQHTERLQRMLTIAPAAPPAAPAVQFEM